VSARAEQPVFYYDLADPACYLAAERIATAPAVLPEWEPVLARSLGIVPAAVDRPAVEAQAASLGIQPVRWPARLPSDSETAMLAATFAKRGGRAVAFSLAAFRQAFAAGRDLGDLDTVLLAGAACEIHPTAMLKGIQLRGVRAALEQACARARSVGVGALPAVALGADLVQGAGVIERAASALGLGV